MSAASIVYQGSPSGSTVIPNGWLPFTVFVSVIVPSLVIRAALPLVVCVNQTEPSGAAAMSCGPTSVSGNSVTTPVAGSRRPTPWGVKRAVNQMRPSVAIASERGTSQVGRQR